MGQARPSNTSQEETTIVMAGWAGHHERSVTTVSAPRAPTVTYLAKRCESEVRDDHFDRFRTLGCAALEEPQVHARSLVAGAGNVASGERPLREEAVGVPERDLVGRPVKLWINQQLAGWTKGALFSSFVYGDTVRSALNGLRSLRPGELDVDFPVVVGGIVAPGEQAEHNVWIKAIQSTVDGPGVGAVTRGFGSRSLRPSTTHRLALRGWQRE